MTEDTREELRQMADRLRNAGWGVAPPERYLSDLPPQFLSLWDQVKPFTMISPERGWALAEAVGHVCAENIPGDIVECGVWKGGACLLASHILASGEPRTSRRIWLYDTFTGMVHPGGEDRIHAGGQPLCERSPEGWWAAGTDEVRQTLSHSPLDAESFKLIPGPVEDTLDHSVPDSIAVLRLDTDWYASTLRELEVLYPKLSPGGILIIDDYGHFTGARRAVDEYFASRGLTPLIHRTDYTGRVIVK